MRNSADCSKEIEKLESAERNNEADPIFQPELYKIQKDSIKVSNEIERYEKGKSSKNADINGVRSFKSQYYTNVPHFTPDSNYLTQEYGQS